MTCESTFFQIRLLRDKEVLLIIDSNNNTLFKNSRANPEFFGSWHLAQYFHKKKEKSVIFCHSCVYKKKKEINSTDVSVLMLSPIDLDVTCR